MIKQNNTGKRKLKKLFMLFILSLIFILLLVNSVNALGVNPARKLFNYEDGSSSGSIKLTNTQNKEMKLAIYVKGEFADKIKLDTSLVSFAADEASKTIGYQIEMPSDLEPGRHRTDIVIMELPSDLGNGMTIITDQGVIVTDEEGKSSSISAINALSATVYVDVPYPGKYLDAKLHISSGSKGDNLVFTVPLVNKGDQNIKTIDGTIIIKGPTNEEISRVNTNNITLSGGESGKIVANWKADVNPGLYYAEAVINFDGQQIVKREVFMVGDKTLKIVNLIIDKFKLGQIAKVDVLAQSVWNEVIKGVYAELDIIDSKGIITQSVKTSSVDIPSLGSSTLSGYWDTEGMSIGKYDINVKLFYGDNKTSEKLFGTVINLDSIQISDPAMLAGQVTSDTKGKNSTITILIIAVLILAIINVTWLFYFKKFRKK